MKAAKPDVPVASVEKVDEADDPARVADAVVDLAKVAAEVVDRAKVDRVVDDSVVDRVADADLVSRRTRSRKLWTQTKTASFPPRKSKTQPLLCEPSTKTKMENWIATNSDRLGRKVADDPVVVARELVAPDSEPAWSIDCWPTTKTKMAKSRKRKLLNS